MRESTGPKVLYGLEPAVSAIRMMGGPTKVATLCGVAVSTVYRWTWPRGVNHGTGGLVPQKYQIMMLREAKAQGIDLTPAHFYPEDVRVA